jgi:hypothetical protein
MAIILPGNSFALGAPDVYIVEASQLPNVAFNNGVNKVGMVGESNWGPETGVTRITNLSEAIAMFGTRQTGNLIKYMETFFNEAGGGENAGAELWVRRAVSETGGVKADRDITAGTDTITITAKYPGTFGNSIYTQIDATGGTTFDLTITVGSATSELYYSQTYKNLTNTSTDVRYFLNIITNDPYVDITKTGTGSTIPSTETSPVALAGGTDYTIADGNYLTCLDDLKLIDGIRGVFVDKETTSALYTGLKTFCDTVGTCLAITSPEDDSSVATVIAEAEGKLVGSSSRMMMAYPSDYPYYNREDDAWEDQGIAWFAGVLFRYESNQSPILKSLQNSRAFGTSISESNLDALARANVCVGGYKAGKGSCVLCAKMLSTDDMFADISMTRRIIDIEADIDVALFEYLGSVDGMNEAKFNITGILTQRLSWWKDRKWIQYGEDPVTGAVKEPYEISFPDFSVAEFNAGIVRVSINLWLAPTITHIIAKVYRNQ